MKPVFPKYKAVTLGLTVLLTMFPAARNLAAQGTLSAISVTPQNGTGYQQSFSFLSSDSNGGTYITGLQLLIAGPGNGYTSACDFWIDRGSSGIWLRNDANTGWGSPVIAGQAGTLQNSQCVLDSATSSIVPSGNYLTVTLNITSFKPAYVGMHNISMELWDTGGLHTGPVSEGAYTVTVNSAPSAISVSPQNGTGTQQSFVFSSSDANGGTDITGLQLLIAGPGNGYTSACDFWIDRGSSGIWLRNDANTGWGSPVIAGQAGTLQNSQCVLDSATSSIVPSGNYLTVTLNITSFKPAYVGAHNISMELWDTGGLHTGPVSEGAYTVTTAAPDFSLSISPSSRSITAGSAAQYTVTVSGVNGFSGTVSFQSPSELPSGASASYNPTTVTGSGSTTLMISTTSNVQTGTFPFTVTGTSGSLNHQTSASLTIQNGPDFTLSISPSATVWPGGATAYTVTVTGLNGFNGAVSFSTSGLPSGTSATYSPSSISGSGSAIMTLSASTGVQSGTYVLTVNASSGSLFHSATASLWTCPHF